MTWFATQTATNIEYTAELIRNSKHAVVLTGAGISTPSGIPDFRSEGTGLWANKEAMDAASLASFRVDPEKFFFWFRPLASQIFNANPNPAHIALAELENAGYINTIITQNIDILHQKAGSRHIIETHGTLKTLTCTQCFHQVGSDGYLEDYIRNGDLPKCNHCRAILKPDVILFGEQLPQKAWFQALQESRSCDLMLVAGSSLEVLPVAGLPMQAIDRGAHLVIMNNTETYLNVRADIVITEDIADVLPAIAKKVIHG